MENSSRGTTFLFFQATLPHRRLASLVFPLAEPLRHAHLPLQQSPLLLLENPGRKLTFPCDNNGIINAPTGLYITSSG